MNMKNQYIEMTVKRKSFQGMENLKKATMILIIATLLVGYAVVRPLLILTIILVLIYYFAVLRLDSEFEYFYMDGELTVSRIINQARRKDVLTVKESMITLIAPYDSPEIDNYGSLKLIDCSAKDPENPPYVMICQYKNTQTKLYLQFNEAFLKILKQEMPYKVIKDVG